MTPWWVRTGDGKRRPYSIRVDCAKTRWLALPAVAAVVALAWGCQRVEVRGHSMAPTLAPGDRLLVRRLLRTPRRLRADDLVVLADPRDPSRPLVKRVAALPGQLARAGGAVLAAGPDSIVVLGDHPGASTDSRSYGPVDLAAVRGRVWYRYAPPERAGRLRRSPRRG